MGITVDMAVVIEQLLVLFLVMGIGYVAMKGKAITENFASGLSDFVLNITLPCLILAAALSTDTELSIRETLQIFGLNLLIYVAGTLVGWITMRLLKVPRKDRGLGIFMMTFANVGFMGFPVIQAIFGADGLFYAVISNIVFNVMSFTLGLYLVRQSSETDEDPAVKTGSQQSLKERFGWLLRPGVVASLLALVLYFINPTVPTVILQTLDLIGDTTTPLAMLIIGMSLARISFREVFTDWRLYPFMLVKQIVLPLLMLLVFSLFTDNQLLIGVLTVLAGMPVATNSVLFAESFNANLPLATKTTFITTLATLVTIPALVWFLGNFLA